MLGLENLALQNAKVPCWIDGWVYQVFDRVFKGGWFKGGGYNGSLALGSTREN